MPLEIIFAVVLLTFVYSFSFLFYSTCLINTWINCHCRSYAYQGWLILFVSTFRYFRHSCLHETQNPIPE